MLGFIHGLGSLKPHFCYCLKTRDFSFLNPHFLLFFDRSKRSSLTAIFEPNFNYIKGFSDAATMGSICCRRPVGLSPCMEATWETAATPRVFEGFLQFWAVRACKS
ncbi:hypothetical protein ES288_A13G144800v1 [Gossypium darwinii]|uniref:Uncharacterized protein n=2 Tax=Gossypium TaxID=3633 RepID=A0A5D2ML49_GOSTO|nr:hypothetical protein ES288_A13G144800v1 [Gossypium darwinii]TYH91928.1 hypothetical protein ES332_A13G147300v1 [Gossypium tomentosum]